MQKGLCAVASHNIPRCEQRDHLGKAVLQIIELEDKVVEITAMEQNKEKRMKRKGDSLQDLWNNNKHTNIHIMGVPEGEEGEKRPEKISEEQK